MSMYIKKPYLILGIGVGVGVITCAVHLYQRKRKEEILNTTHSRIKRTIKIPKTSVGHVLGRHGANIKNIREKTRARIVFDDQGDYTIATITGLPEEVEDAVNEINEIISSRTGTITREIPFTDTVSDSVFKNINIIRQICDMTRAKITFDVLPAKNRDTQCIKAIVKGKKEEVDAAMDLIDELVAEVELNLNKPVHVVGRPLPNNLSLNAAGAKNKTIPTEKLISSHPDGYIEVFVSAVDTPGKFWVQISGSKSVQLDKLATEMTEFYDDPKNKEKFQIQNINVDDLVAAYFQGDTSWYRAQVLKVSEEEKGKKISVFYADFGDCAILDPECIRVLKTEFLSIPFQAVECTLVNIQPVEDKWTEEASDEFEKMVHLGCWKVLMAKPLRETVKTGEESSNSITPLIELLDTHAESNINIGKELVSRGYARFLDNLEV